MRIIAARGLYFRAGAEIPTDETDRASYEVKRRRIQAYEQAHITRNRRRF